MTEKQKILLAFLAGLIIGIGGYALFEDSSQSSSSMNEKETSLLEEGASLGEVVVSDAESMLKDENGLVSMTATDAPGLRAEPVMLSGQNIIAVLDQSAGGKATVQMATLSEPGWVAIHEDRSGNMGNVLGAKYVEPGIHLVEVNLLRGMTSGGTYYAVLYKDNGDKDFSLAGDPKIKNDKGEIVFAKFRAQ